MTSHEMSLEELHMSGMGFGPRIDNNYRTSVEGYDGFDDGIAMEFARSEEALNFIDNFSIIEQKNAADKIKMLRKLAVTYGNPNNMDPVAAQSIEAFCYEKSMEAEETAAATNDAPAPTEKPKDTGKKKGFFATILGAIKKFFQTIWEFLKKIVNNIVEFFQKFKSKQQETAPKTDAAASTDVSSSSKSSSSDGDREFKVGNLILNWADSRINASGLDRFITTYTRLTDNIKALDNTIDTTSKQVLSDINARNARNSNYKEQKELTKANIDSVYSSQAFQTALNNIGSTINNICDIVGFVNNNGNVSGAVRRRALNFTFSKFKGTDGSRHDGKEFKKYLENISKNILITTNNNRNREVVYGIVQRLFGLRSLANEQDTIQKRNFQVNQAMAKQSIEVLGNIEKHSLSKLDKPHKTVLDTISKYESKLKINDKQTDALTSTQSGLVELITCLKFASKLEAAVVKVFNILNKSCIEFVKMQWKSEAEIQAERRKRNNNNS